MSTGKLWMSVYVQVEATLSNAHEEVLLMPRSQFPSQTLSISPVVEASTQLHAEELTSRPS